MAVRCSRVQAEQGAVPGVVGLGGVEQAGVDGGPVHLLGQAFQLLEGGQQDRGAGPPATLILPR